MKDLYDYQADGVEWLVSHPRALLLDEQGLGKTITAIAVADRTHSDKVLVICPSVVLWNWAREFYTWSPDRRVQIIDTGDTRVDPAADVVITTHGLIIRPFVKAQLLGLRWDLTIIDEVHFFRTPTTQRTRVLYGEWKNDKAPTLVQKSTRVLGLTGTPMPNNASELWTHLWGLTPHLITPTGKKGPQSFSRFRHTFCKMRRGRYGMKITGNRNLPALRPIVQKMSLRRLIRDVLPDLPSIRYVNLSLRPFKLPKVIDRLSTYLRPRVSKLLRDGEVSFSTLRESTEFAEFRRLCGIAKAGPIVELLSMKLTDGDLDKVIVFAHHSDVISTIASGLGAFGAVTITGATRPKMRQRAVDLFQFHPGVRVIVCNIVAGGVGVTLTEAHQVYMAEMSFVPGENAQAAKRAHRIGQDMPVLVHCVSLAGTSDEIVVDALRLKTTMIREVLS